METTYTHTTTTEKTTPAKISNEGQISKRALITFLSGASIVFFIAIYYCMTTSHVVEGTVLLGAFIAICIFAASMYKSFK